MSVHPLRRDEESAPFFDATAEGRLLLRRCTCCGRHLAPAAQTCQLGSTALEWVEASGGGHLASWAAVHDKPDADGNTHPLVIALVELDEGPWLRGQVVRAAPEDMAAGARVTVEFEQPEGGEAIPVFALAERPHR